MNEAHKTELDEFYEYFQTAKFPSVPFHLNKYLVIWDPILTVDSTIRAITEYKGSDEVRDSLFKHLREMKAICEKVVGAT